MNHLFHEAWDRYKDLLRACPHHGFTKLHQLDTFYNALNPADQDSLNSAAGGNLLERRTQDVLTIIENKSKIPVCYDDDDDEERSIPLKDSIISELPLCVAITPALSTEEPVDSLIMDNEHLDTILETESDEFIKSSIENLVQNPSESEDFSDIESECDMPVCDNFTTFSNLLFDANDYFSSSDDKSFFDEDVPNEIYSNPLFDEEIISVKIDSSIISMIDSLLEQFSGELAHNDLIPLGINEANFDLEEDIHFIERLLYDNSSPRPPKAFQANSDTIIESFPHFLTPLRIVTLLANRSIYFPVQTMQYHRETNTFDNSLPESKTFCFNLEEISSGNPTSYLDLSLPDYEAFFCDSEPDSGNFTMDVVEDISDNPTRELYVHVLHDLPIHPTLHLDSDFTISSDSPESDLVVSFPSGDRNKIYDLGICIEVESTRFLATHSHVIDTLLPFSSENDDKVFNHDVPTSKEKSPPSSSHRGFKASKLFHQKSQDVDSWRGHSYLGCPVSPFLSSLTSSSMGDRDCPDFKASRARGFVLRSLELQILNFILGIQYPNLID
ncbi:hypothetical protein Tco_0077379 [Tanacetum coccineum]